jgi:integrase/recombinase XerD
MTSNIYALKDLYLLKQKEKNRSKATIRDTNERLEFFFRWLREVYSLSDVREITKDQIRTYQDYVNRYRKKNGEGLSKSRKRYLLNTLLYWFKFLEKEEVILKNPGADIEVLSEGRTLPKDILTEKEVSLLLKAPDLRLPEGLRDRSILEILYGSALRNTELRSLRLSDVDMENCYLFVKGKGSKDRVVPMTRKAKRYLKEYLTKVRPVFLQNRFLENRFLQNSAHPLNEEILFITREGSPIRVNGLTKIVRNYRKVAGLTKKVTPHTLRHSCAAHLIERGANIRYVQELLGHSKIDTTQIYTAVMPVTLKKVYEATHPRCL